MELSLFIATLFFVTSAGELRAESSDLPIIFTQVPTENSIAGHATLPGGSRLARLNPAGDDWRVSVLSKGFAAAGRATVSFDAKRVLFVGRRSESDPTGVWEMNVDGSSARLITVGPGDCRSAIYLSTIYTIDADAPYHQIAFLAGAKKTDPSQLFTCRLDGSRLGQITFAPFGVADPMILSDGRILCSVIAPPSFESSIPGDRPVTTLMTLHVDGTELFAFAVQDDNPKFLAMPCETQDDLIVYVESIIGLALPMENLVTVDKNRRLQDRRSFTMIRNVGLSPLPNGSLLTSRLALREGGSSYGVFTVGRSEGTATSLVFDDPDWHDLDARAIYRRKQPEGRSSVIKRTSQTKSEKNQRTGHLYGLNAYLSDTAKGANIQPGDIESLRVIELRSGASKPSHSPHTLKTPNDRRLNQSGFHEFVLGMAPVESDGSFFIEVPAQIPIRLETLGKDGTILQRMKSWFWVMPGERRGCIGCHEDRELTPPNRHVEALRKKPHRIGLPALPQTGHQE